MKPMALYRAGLLIISLVVAPVGQLIAADNPDKTIRLATTTSTDNSGLLSQLLPRFTESSGYDVHVIAVGTGKALRMGRDGDVDLVLVHARQAEDKFVADGFGEKRYGVMYNDFVIVGPEGDPAGIRNAQSAAEALAAIAQSRSIFVSRGDDSGTHQKELRLWHAAKSTPSGRWYREAGQGMGKVLQIAAEMDGYTLTDRGTWLAYEKKSPLQIAFEGDPVLYNPYGIIAVNPARHPDANHRGAVALIKWMISPAGQEMIRNFRIGKHSLFTPAADSGEFASFIKSY